MTAKCFVISPIGDPASDIRKHADKVFELVIEPAVEKFGFDLIRGDKLPGSNSITEEIIELVRESEICIADLTGHNPNVFYELGRRHETAKPTILIISQAEKAIPFDLANLRIIKYDLTKPDEIRTAYKAIQGSIESAKGSDFEAKSKGATLSSVMHTLERLERKVSQLQSTGPIGGQAGQAQYGLPTKGPKGLLSSPADHLRKALLDEDIGEIVATLPRVQHLPPNDLIVTAASIAAIQLHPIGAETLNRIVSQFDPQSGDIRNFKSSITALVEYYSGRDEEHVAVEVLQDHVMRVAQSDLVKPTDKAYLWNQYQRALHGAREFERALIAGEKAVEYAPDEPSYHFNISTNLGRLGRHREALAVVNRCLAIGQKLGKEVDVDHLGQAYRMSRAAGELQEAKRLLQVIEQIDPQMAIRLSKEHD